MGHVVPGGRLALQSSDRSYTRAPTFQHLLERCIPWHGDIGNLMNSCNFADDTTPYASGYELNEMLINVEHDSNVILEWTITWL